MVRITIDNELKAKLLAATGVVELCDESGELLAQAILNRNKIPEGWVRITPELSEAEYQRRLNSNEPGITTEELLSRLREKL